MKLKLTKHFEFNDALTFCSTITPPTHYVFQIKTHDKDMEKTPDQKEPALLCCAEMFTGFMELIYKCCDKDDVTSEIAFSPCQVYDSFDHRFCSYYCFITLQTPLTGPWIEYGEFLNLRIKKDQPELRFRDSQLLLLLQTQNSYTFQQKKNQLVKQFHLKLTK